MSSSARMEPRPSGGLLGMLHFAPSRASMAVGFRLQGERAEGSQPYPLFHRGQALTDIVKREGPQFVNDVFKGHP